MHDGITCLSLEKNYKGLTEMNFTNQSFLGAESVAAFFSGLVRMTLIFVLDYEMISDMNLN